MNRFRAAKKFGLTEGDIINIDGKIIFEQMNKNRTNKNFGAEVVTDETLTKKISNLAIDQYNLSPDDAMKLAKDRMNSVRHTKRINKVILFVIIFGIVYWITS